MQEASALSCLGGELNVRSVSRAASDELSSNFQPTRVCLCIVCVFLSVGMEVGGWICLK